MESFIGISSQIKNIHTQIKRMIFFGLLIQIVALVIFMKIVYPKQQVIEKEALHLKNLNLLEICEIGMASLGTEYPNDLLLNQELIKEIKKSKVKFIIDEVLEVKKTALNQCTVLVKENEGTRLFELTLQKHPSFPFGDKIIDIQEKVIPHAEDSV